MHTIRQSTGVCYFQRRIPLDLQSDFGKTKFVFSLKTKNRETAKAQARIRSVELLNNTYGSKFYRKTLS